MSIGAHLSDDRLIDLASGLLRAEVGSDVVRHLESCPACEARLRTAVTEAQRVRLLRPRPSARRPLWWGVAAAAVLVAAALLFWPPSKTADPAVYWFPLGPKTVSLRTGAVSAEEAVFEEAADAYRRKDAARTVRLLKGKTIPEARDRLRIALASALVKTGEPATARQVIQEMRVETIPQPDRDRVRWILCAALLAEGKEDEARALAVDLASRPGEFEAAAKRFVRAP